MLGRFELARLHELEQVGIWVRLELINDESVADDVLFEPSLLGLNHRFDLHLILNQLRLFLKKVANVVTEKIIGDNESFVAFGALLTGIRDAVRIVVVLTWCANEGALLLQSDQVVYIIRELLQLGEGLLERLLVH